MKLRPDQLAGQLKSGLAPIYLVGGEEPLLVLEACDQIRATAKAQGYADREVFHVQAGFDWSALSAAAASLSLFAQRRVLEVRLEHAKPGDAGSKALQAYAKQPAADTILLVVVAKLDKATLGSKWGKTLEAKGVAVPVWPLEARNMPGWIAQRLHNKGLQADQQVCQLLAHRLEGNLLAAAQEIDKLALLAGDEPLTPKLVAASVADSARFNVFQLAEYAMNGQAVRALRMLANLRLEGAEPVVLHWSLSRNLRCALALAEAGGQRQNSAAVLKEYRIWPQQQAAMQKAASRLSANQWRQLVLQAAQLERQLKGQAADTLGPWEGMRDLVAAMAGAVPPLR